MLRIGLVARLLPYWSKSPFMAYPVWNEAQSIFHKLLRTLLKVFNVLNFILLFTYFLQPFETGCGVVSDITSAHY